MQGARSAATETIKSIGEEASTPRNAADGPPQSFFNGLLGKGVNRPALACSALPRQDAASKRPHLGDAE